MDAGLLYALLTACIWAAVGCGYGAAARRRLAMAPFVAVAASVGALIGVSCTIRWAGLPAWREAVPVAAFIAMSGATGQMGMLLNGAAMTVAPRQSSATWSIFQMSMIVPFLVSNLSGREHAAWYKWPALLFVLLALRAFKSKSGQAEDSAANGKGWFGLLLVAFVCAGIAQALAQEISLRGLHDTLNLRTTVTLGAGGMLLWIVTFLRGERPTPRHWLLGGLTGLLVAAGNVTLFVALDACALHGRAYMVFPIAVAGSILLFAVYQVASGKEPCGIRKILGVACSVAGVALLGVR
ncbi:MAG: hypothetical protein Q7T82_04820 [Armatimonadota bacterium]|nr:hypothetical protein [Armatimonadota bacterium]